MDPSEQNQAPSQGIVDRTLGVYRRGADFFTQTIWEQRIEDMPSGKAWAYKTARVAQSTLRAVFFGDTLQVRAAALTYFTVLSLVPLLAFAFALLKGFGAYDVLVKETLRPYLRDFLSGNESLQTAVDQILGFVENTGVTSLGFIGLITLLYAATRLLRNIELALNEIWLVHAGREAVQQLRDYVAIIVVTPICMMAGAGLTTAGQALEIVQAAGKTLGISQLLDQLISVLGPLFVLFLGLLFLYTVMPYTRVRFLSGLTGAAVGAVLWYAVLIIHVRFQVGVANYNALYSELRRDPDLPRVAADLLAGSARRGADSSVPPEQLGALPTQATRQRGSSIERVDLIGSALEHRTSLCRVRAPRKPQRAEQRAVRARATADRAARPADPRAAARDDR